MCVVVVIPREDTQTTQSTPRELVISILCQDIGRPREDHTRAGRTALWEAIEDRLRAGQTTQRPRSQRTDARHAADTVREVRTKLGEELLELIEHHAWGFLSDISRRIVEASGEVIQPILREVLFGSVASRERDLRGTTTQVGHRSRLRHTTTSWRSDQREAVVVVAVLTEVQTE